MTRRTLTFGFTLTIFAVVGSDAIAQRQPQANANRVPPAHADVKYGPHERNVFDLWLPENAADSAQPLPVFVWFHGGGFVTGDKSGFDPAPYLKEGIAVVSANYRFVDGESTFCPAPLQDGARVIQTIRARADEWKLDSERIAVSGSSAGAVITMWIGYHDDLAAPRSNDPVARLSTRVKCIAPLNGPANLDPRWITANLGGPKFIHTSFPKMFGAEATTSDAPEVRKRIRESSPIEFVSADDPPTLLVYAGTLEGIPLPESASSGVLVHHPYFGKVLQEKLEAAGVPAELHTGIQGPAGLAIILDWLKKNL